MKELGQSSRNYGIDLLKTLSMFMVIILHILGAGGILTNSQGTNYWVAYLLEIACFCAVNCFAMATGFLMVGRKFKYRRIIKLWVIVAAWYLSLTLISAIIKPEIFNYNKFANCYTVTGNVYWYFTSYFGMFFFIPFLNLFIEKSDKKTFYILLITGFFILSLSSIINPINNDPFIIKAGYSPWWLMYVYLIGAGIKKYDLFKNISQPFALLGYFACVILTCLIKYTIHNLSQIESEFFRTVFISYDENRFLFYNSPTVLLCGVFLFLFISRINVPKFLHGPLRFSAPLVFQVYIIHMHFSIWKFIAGEFVSYASRSPVVMIVLILATALVIFVGCIILDFIRSLIFKILQVDKIIDIISDRTADMLNKSFANKFSENKTTNEEKDTTAIPN